MKIPTPDDYVKHVIVMYPTLYAGKGIHDYPTCRLKVFNQLFNVIGNGIRDDEELLEEISYDSCAHEFNETDHIKGSFYYGYTEMDEVKDDNGNIIASFPKVGSSITIPERDKNKHPEVVKWLRCSAYPFKPYPNFKEDYSLVYKAPIFLELGNEWIFSAIRFYESCRTWFQTNECKYHGAFPCENEDEDNRRISQMEGFLKKYKTHDEITKAYECEFNGDVVDFMIRRWEIERTRIHKFIDKTVDMLQNHVQF